MKQSNTSAKFHSLAPKKTEKLTVEVDAELRARVKAKARKQHIKIRQIVEHGFILFLEEK